jgi:hypothetical protein
LQRSQQVRRIDMGRLGVVADVKLYARQLTFDIPQRAIAQRYAAKDGLHGIL